MTTQLCVPIFTSLRNLFLKQVKSVNFALYRAFKQSDTVNVLCPGEPGLIDETITLDLRRGSSFCARFSDNTELSLENLRDCLPLITFNEALYFDDDSDHDSELCCTKDCEIYDMSTEDKEKYLYLSWKFVFITDFWRIKDDVEENYTYILRNCGITNIIKPRNRGGYNAYVLKGKKFTSKLYECCGENVIYVPEIGFESPDHRRIGTAEPGDEINIIIDIDGVLIHVESDTWIIYDNVYVEYIDNEVPKYILLPDTLFHVKRLKHHPQNMQFIVVDDDKGRSIPMSQILMHIPHTTTKPIKLWETNSSDIKVTEIKEGYLQVTVCTDSKFTVDQQVNLNMHGTVTIKSFLLEITGKFTNKFSGKLIVDVAGTHAIVEESDLSSI